MKNEKMNGIFNRARAEQAPPPSPDFEADVMRAIRSEPRAGERNPCSINSAFFPAAVGGGWSIVMCVAAD